MPTCSLILCLRLAAGIPLNRQLTISTVPGCGIDSRDGALSANFPLPSERRRIRAIDVI
jgi:hypothetical protein